MMNSVRRRDLIAMHSMWWGIAVVLLSALQPFLFTHFRHDGWEDEPGFRLRNVAAVAIFESDPRSDQGQQMETTLFVPVATGLNLTDELDAGLTRLMGLVLLVVPLLVRLAVPALPLLVRRCESVLDPGGSSPPDAAPWRTLPPQTAPPV